MRALFAKRSNFTTAYNRRRSGARLFIIREFLARNRLLTEPESPRSHLKFPGIPAFPRRVRSRLPPPAQSQRRTSPAAFGVDTEHHLIVTHEVINVGSDRSQLARVAKKAKAALQTDTLEAVADRGYFNGEEILAPDQAGITVTLPKPMTSGAKSEGRFGKQDFAYR